MAYKLKRTSRKPTMRRRRRFNITRKKRTGGKSGVIKMLRWCNADSTNNCALNIVGSDALPAQDGTAQFSMSQIAGSTEVQNLFDQARLLKVYYRWVITRNPDQVTTTANKGVYPRLIWRHDFNDAAIVTRTQMMQSANIKEAYFGDNYQKTRWYALNPAMLMVGYESATQSSYTPKWRNWVDTNDLATLHYGIKYCFSELYSGSSLRLEAKFVIECKGIS